MTFRFFKFKSELANNRYNLTKALFDCSKLSFCLLASLAWFYNDLNNYQRYVIDQINQGEPVDLLPDPVLMQTANYGIHAMMLMWLENVPELYLNSGRLLQRPLGLTVAGCIKGFPHMLFQMGQLLGPMIFLWLMPVVMTDSIPNLDVESNDFVASIMKPICIEAILLVPLCVATSRLSQLLLANRDEFEISAAHLSA